MKDLIITLSLGLTTVVLVVLLAFILIHIGVKVQ